MNSSSISNRLIILKRRSRSFAFAREVTVLVDYPLLIKLLICLAITALFLIPLLYFSFLLFFISELLFLAKLCTCDIHIYVQVRYNFNTISCDSLIQFQSNLDTAYINVENRCRFGFEFDRYRADFYEL